jgi:hypothetical protein
MLYGKLISRAELMHLRRRYALDIDLPDFVVEHPVIQALNQGTNDLVTWSNVRTLAKFRQNLYLNLHNVTSRISFLIMSNNLEAIRTT